MVVDFPAQGYKVPKNLMPIEALKQAGHKAERTTKRNVPKNLMPIEALKRAYAHQTREKCRIVPKNLMPIEALKLTACGIRSAMMVRCSKEPHAD